MFFRTLPQTALSASRAQSTRQLRSSTWQAWRAAFFVLFAILAPVLVATPAYAQDESAGILAGEQAGCASFDDLARNTSFASGASIASGDSITLKVGDATTAESKAIVGEDIADRPGNSLGIIAILIGIVSGNQSASEVEFLYMLETGPVIVRINGQIINLPNLEALDGQTVGGVQIAVGPGDVSGDSVSRLRATGAINSFAVGGKALWIDDLCIKAPGAVAARSLDLGDAPDGSNNWGAPMSAYPTVAAHYPTVFDPATGPVGPAHRTPQPFHLGQNVSREANADWGFDADGLNNISPPVDAKDNDRYDDGLNPTLIPFADCTKPTFPVRIFISPAAAASLPDGKGYINVWVDANRDGDWEDSGQCTPPGGAAVSAGEHFVVDFTVDAAVLGAGLHTVSVVASRHVIWPANLAGTPAWVRVTLSETPSVKQPATGYGDGRGPVPPFVTGETEDYLWRPAGDPANGPDVMITKHGQVVARAIAGDVQGEYNLGLRVMWEIEYRNIGLQPATNFSIADDLIDGSVYESSLVVRTVPSLPYTRAGSVITFDGATLQPGEGGRILIGAQLAGEALAAPLVNRVRITADTDSNPSNNVVESTASAVVPAPQILSPGSGTTNRGDVTLRGLAWGASSIDLYQDGEKIAAPVVSGGKWSHTVTLGDGSVRFVAIARLGNVSSAPSNLVEITIDSNLGWDPLSLRIIGPNGFAQRPTDEKGHTDETGWRVWLRASTPYTVSMALCNNEVIEGFFKFGSQNKATLAGPDSNGRYSATFVSPDTIGTPLDATVDVTCGAASATDAGVPEATSVTYVGRGSAARIGTVRLVDAITLQPVENATIIGDPAYHNGRSWYGCITCTVASAVAAATGTEVAMEDLVVPSATPGQGLGEITFTYSQIGIKATAPGYQPYQQLLKLDFARVGGGLEIRLLPVADELPEQLQIDQCVLLDNEGIRGPLRIAKGKTMCVLNLSNRDRGVYVEETSSASLSGAQPDTAAALSNFNTGMLAPGEAVYFVLSNAGMLTISDAEEPSVRSTIEVVEVDAPSIFLPIVEE